MFDLEGALIYFGVIPDPNRAMAADGSQPDYADPRISIFLRAINELSREVLAAAHRDDLHVAKIHQLNNQLSRAVGLLAFISEHGLESLGDRRAELFRELGVTERIEAGR